jgi:hypothetical protein
MQPYTPPLVRGVAEPAPLIVVHLRAFVPVEVKTCPPVPQEFVQSMMPAPGLIALVLSPYSQRQVLEKPTARLQDSVVKT